MGKWRGERMSNWAEIRVGKKSKSEMGKDAGGRTKGRGGEVSVLWDSVLDPRQRGSVTAGGEER